MKHPKLKIGDRVDMLLIVGCRKAGQGQKIIVYWTVQCDCGSAPREMRTNHIRMPRATVKVSCGCLKKRRASQQLAIARARIGMQERDARDPTPLEIAEECLQIHNDADRQPPVRLMENLRELRQGNGI
jgi:hypothetical protein